VWVLAGLAGAAATAAEVERAMFGNTPARNMVSSEKGLPTKWNPATGLNVQWVAELGSQAYAGPVVAGGKVFVGTNNQREYNPQLKGDRGNVMAFDAATGKLLWQSAHPKLGAGRVNDWPLQGVCSTPFVEGDRVYYVSNRAEVICADTEGFRDGENDGPYVEEGETLQTPEGPKRVPLVSEIDEDVVWKFDMIGELDVFPHNLAAGSPLIVGDILYTVTGQGVDEGHVNIPAPAAPSFVALNKKTGDLVWENALPGENIFHGTWSNAAAGVIAGRAQVIFGGGDGWVYSFEPKTGALLWKFNANPPGARYVLGGSGTANEIISTPVIHGDRVYVGVGQDPEHGEAPGHLWAIDATQSGDVTDTAKVWHVGGERFNRTISTASIHDGLLYVADLSGFVYCFDLATGQQHWKYDSLAAIWGSTFVADGKVYIGDEDGDIAVLRAGKTMELLHEVNMGAAVYTTPVAQDGVMYVASRTRLFALREGIPAKPPAAAAAAPKPAAPAPPPKE
jgi:outer membrane protein assembly factor BamB